MDATPKRKRKPLPPHWYKIYTVECVLCGHTQTWRERQSGKPPVDPYERYDFEQTACGYHFC